MLVARIPLLLLELIDTLWNVNKTLLIRFAVKRSRINRYIMECKCTDDGRSRKRGVELIDTLWNVNAGTDRRYAEL